MFCPNCGKANQQANAYCRQCGNFLPDFNKIAKREISPETHLKANTVLNIMTGIVSITLAILLFSLFLDRQNTPPIIYITAGFLTAIFAWQAQIYWRTMLLKKHLKSRPFYLKENTVKDETANDNAVRPRSKNLPAADHETLVPTSVTEQTTSKFGQKISR